MKLKRTIKEYSFDSYEEIIENKDKFNIEIEDAYDQMAAAKYADVVDQEYLEDNDGYSEEESELGWYFMFPDGYNSRDDEYVPVESIELRWIHGYSNQ